MRRFLSSSRHHDALPFRTPLSLRTSVSLRTSAALRTWAMTALLALCLGFSTTMMASSARAAANAAAAGVDVRSPPLGKLPEGVRPVHYVLELKIDPDQPRFSGDVQIELELQAPTQVIWLHGRGLNVTTVEVLLPDGARRAAQYKQHSPDGVAAVTVAAPLPAGRMTLHMSYDAPFDEQLAGAYRVAVGKQHYVFTQFEAIDARRAFPCFDEPRFKTPFALTISHPAGVVAVANSPESGAQPLPDGGQMVRFQSTPPLPTYLVAFAVGDFDIVEWSSLARTALRDRVVPLRGIAVKGKGAQLRQALALTEPMVTRLEQYFAQPYPFAKLDIVAVPDFAAGAMENAGLITYRDSILLLGDKATEGQRRGLITIHAHELAHQWVGDLVTPPWWDDIWLNESFATWMESKIAQQIDPAGHYDRALLAGTHAAMAQDSLPSARQVRDVVSGAEDIAVVFDGIAYEKGGAVLAMLEGYLGEADMRDGIQRYFRRHSGGTATSDDLIRALVEGNGDVKLAEALNSFLSQPGVPLLTVRTACRNGGAELSIRQSRYEPLGYKSVRRADRWRVPLCMRTSTGQQCNLLEQNELRVVLDACPDWVMPNAGGLGYYRFSLDKASFQNLVSHVDQLTDREQIALADSVMAGFQAGQYTFADVLALAKKLAVVPEREVATALIDGWERVHWSWLDERQRTASAAQIRAVFAARLQQLDTRQPDQRLFAANLQRFVAIAGEDPALRAELATAAMRYLAATDEIQSDSGLLPEFLRTALTVAVVDRGADAFDAIVGKLATTNDGFVREAMVNALGAAATPALQSRVHALLLAKTLRRNEVDGLLSTLPRQGRAAQHWPWIEANIDALVGLGSTSLGTFAPYLGASTCTSADLQRLKSTFGQRARKWEGADHSLKQSTNVVQSCIATRKRQLDGVLAALGTHDR